MTDTESVVLLDETGQPCGSFPKADVHTFDTPLHLAFSCYLFNPAGELLVTRRALSKIAWAGVWTNSFCGHPAPGESFESAIERRALAELGVTVNSIELVLPDFRYRAVDASGIVENEVCPVFTARTSDALNPSAEEVCEWEWTQPAALGLALASTPWVFSPWLRWQSEQLEFLT